MRVWIMCWLVSLAVPATALIKVEFPVAKIYGEAGQVLVGSVAEVRSEARLAVVRVDTALKGERPAGLVRLHLAQPDGLISGVTTGSPAVIFAARDAGGSGMAILHLSDTWLLGNAIPNVSPTTWRVSQVYDAARSFPGRTAALARLVERMKAGASAMDDAIDPEGFDGERREVADLGAAVLFLLAVDFNDDARLDVVAGTLAGLRALRREGSAFRDVTAEAGLAGQTAQVGACGDLDGDGMSECVLDGVAWRREKGRGFERGAVVDDAEAAGKALAAAVCDVNGDGAADVVSVSRTGELRVRLNPGKAGGAWTGTERPLWAGGDGASAAVFSDRWSEDESLSVIVVRGQGLFRHSAVSEREAPADFVRMTGASPAGYGTLTPLPLRAVAAAAVDCDGNRRPDFLLLTESGGIALMNRGMGAFMANAGLHEKVRTAAGRVAMAAMPAAGMRPGRQDLVVGGVDGKIFEIRNIVKGK